MDRRKYEVTINPVHLYYTGLQNQISKLIQIIIFLKWNQELVAKTFLKLPENL